MYLGTTIVYIYNTIQQTSVIDLLKDLSLLDRPLGAPDWQNAHALHALVPGWIPESFPQQGGLPWVANWSWKETSGYALHLYYTCNIYIYIQS